MIRNVSLRALSRSRRIQTFQVGVDRAGKELWTLVSCDKGSETAKATLRTPKLTCLSSAFMVRKPNGSFRTERSMHVSAPRSAKLSPWSSCTSVLLQTPMTKPERPWSKSSLLCCSLKRSSNCSLEYLVSSADPLRLALMWGGT